MVSEETRDAEEVSFLPAAVEEGEEVNKQITIGEKYEPAMQIQTQAEADLYFECCVKHTMSFGESREESERIERTNLGYYAGYYDTETRERVERLFHCAHPVFGSLKREFYEH